MTETAKAITEYGVLVVIAVVFVLAVWRLFTSWMKQAECLKKDYTKAVEGFIDTANQFNQTAIGFNVTISNHLEHETQAFAEMTKAIEHLCWYIEKDGQHDYRKRDD